jgi:DnaJ-class molecular chaperone
MSRWLSQLCKTKAIRMDFGKRFSIHNNRTAPVIQHTCVRCCGTGRIRERGNRIICIACAGAGRTTVITERAS